MAQPAVPMNQSQQKALLALLQDADAGTVSLVKEQLVAGGAEKLQEYYSLMDLASGAVARHLQEVVDRLESAESLGRVSRLLARMKTFDQLEELCWELARAEQPAFRSQPFTQQLQDWGELLQKSVSSVQEPTDQIRQMTAVLAGELRLIGDQQNYYHPRNSYLPWVMEFRKGLPLTLTLLYVLVGRRAGLTVEGVNAPGHFIARLNGVNFDPYYGGRIISTEEWNRILAEVPPDQHPAIQTACTPLQFSHRMLVNLRNSYLRRGDSMRQERIDRFLAVLQH